MNIVSHSTVYQTKASPRRDPLGVVLHNTVTQGLVPPHPNGSWHYEIDRDGTCHQYVNDKDIVWNRSTMNAALQATMANTHDSAVSDRS